MPRTSESDWLGLALRSESDEPHEWPALAWVIRNRVESNRYPDTYYEVITQAYQFSYFNQFRGIEDSEELFAVAKEGYAGDNSGWDENDFVRAKACAASVMMLPRWAAPFSHRVLYFWAPGAMVPRGSDPSWASDLKYVFTLPGNHRWKFGEP